MRLGLGLLVGIALAAGCSDEPCALGADCSLLCCTPLSCVSDATGAGHCDKGCRCDPSQSICAPVTLRDGCPSGAACVVTEPDGTGRCVVLCAHAACPPSEGSCAPAPDGTPVCVGPAFSFAGIDGGAGGG